MGKKMTIIRILRHVDGRQLALVALAGFFAVFLALVAMPTAYTPSFTNLSFLLSKSTRFPEAATAHDQQSGLKREDQTSEMKPVCETFPRSILCQLEGDIRVLGRSSSVIKVSSSMESTSSSNHSWRVQPYARKGDKGALQNVREVTLRYSNAGEVIPDCTVNHSVPAVVFSSAGYLGNLFHDFSDVLIPLFLTAHRYNGEVKFLVTNKETWWTNKHHHELSGLSRYQIIDFDNDDRVHCFPRVVVGLIGHLEFNINPLLQPLGTSMADFSQFMRSSYSLARQKVEKIEQGSAKKPRLLIISRKRTRSFLNIDEIVKMASELSFEVIVEEAKFGDMAKFAGLMNSCDVLMGVHGAGLSNLVFLPRNATVIQIVPWGRIEGIARYCFGTAAENAGLQYLQYEINLEESSLIQQYPRDHPTLKDPLSVHRHGWNAIREAFLVKQNIKLDVIRFRDVLLKALRHVHHS